MQSQISMMADAQAIADLVNAAYQGSGKEGRHGWTHEAELINGDRTKVSDIMALIADASTTVLLRRQDGSPALLGCVAVAMKSEKKCLISMLAVAPECQGGAIGRSLLEDAQELAAGMGASTAKITVVEQRETLLAWYERRGFRRTGSYEAFPYDIDGCAVPLRDDLRFVVMEKALTGVTEGLHTER